MLSQGGGVDRTKLAQMGWAHDKSVTPDGSEVHYFPMIWIGHGIGVIPTIVVIPRSGSPAIVVQADVSHLCGMAGMKTQTPLCSDTRKALGDIALRVEGRYAGQGGK